MKINDRIRVWDVLNWKIKTPVKKRKQKNKQRGKLR